MHSKNSRALLWGLISIGALLWACQREFERPRWDTNVLAPLVKTKLNLANLSTDTSIKVESDNSLTLVQRKKLFTYTIDSLVTLEAPQFKRTVKLSTLVLANQTLTRRISLGEIARQLKAQGSPLGDQIFLAHNLGRLGIPATIPNIDNITAGPVDIDVNDFFRTATLLQGTLTIQALNRLPLTLSNIQLQLRNKNGNEIITNQQFINLTPNSTQTNTEDLAGKTIEGNLVASIADLDIQGASVIVDTASAIVITLTVSNLQVFEATAIFPAQEVVNETSDVTLLGLDDVRLTLATIRQGRVRADVYSTAEDTVRFSYEIPSATKNGETFIFYAEVPPAPPGGTSYKQFVSDFSGYNLDLTGVNRDTFNTFYGTLVGRIDYTGRVVNLSLADSLDITLTLEDAKPSYIKGYLGQDTIAFGPEEIDIDVFKNVQANYLAFDSIRIIASVENSLGIPSQGKITHLQTVNTQTSQSATLTGPILNTYQAIQEATDNPLTPQTTVIDLSSNTNAVDLINIQPDKLYYIGDFTTNPLGNDQTYEDFARSGVSLNATIDVEIPLQVQAEQLVLSDTAAFDASSLRTTGARSGTLRLFVDNMYPLDIQVELLFLDNNGLLIDSELTSPVVPAGVVNANGIVEAPSSAVIPVYFSEGRLNALIDRCTDVVFKVQVDSKPNNSFVKLYSTYFIDLKISGDLTIGINQ